MGEDEIDKLTSGMAAGNSNAVDTFYRRYFDWLYAQARRVTRRDESFCLDIVQDAVLRIIRTIRPVQSERQFRSWLGLVVQTTALDHLRNERRRKKRELATVPSDGGGTDEDSNDADRYAWLKEKLLRFDPQMARMIELRFEQRWTLARMAKLLGLSIGTIDGRLRRALKRLKDEAPEEFDE